MRIQTVVRDRDEAAARLADCRKMGAPAGDFVDNNKIGRQLSPAGRILPERFADIPGDQQDQRPVKGGLPALELRGQPLAESFHC